MYCGSDKYLAHRPLWRHYQDDLPMGAGIVSKTDQISLNCLELTGKVKKCHILLPISLGVDIFFHFITFKRHSINLNLVYYIIRTSTQRLLLCDTLLFLLIYLNHIRLHKTLSYRSYSLYFFTLLILKFIYIYVHYYVFLYYYCYPALGALNISFY